MPHAAGPARAALPDLNKLLFVIGGLFAQIRRQRYDNADEVLEYIIIITGVDVTSHIL